MLTLTPAPPTLTASVRTTPPASGFTTADFDLTGLDVVALGVITAGAPVDDTIFRSAENGGPLGSLAAGGDLELQTDQSITRIARNIQTDDIRIWDNPAGLALSTFFADNPDLSLRIQFPSSGPYILTPGVHGGNRSSWNATNTTARNEIDAISEGDEFIIAVAQTTATEEQVQGDIESGAPTVTAQVRTSPPPSRIRGALTSGTPTLTARVRTRAPGDVQVSGAITSGAPTVAAQIRNVAAQPPGFFGRTPRQMMRFRGRVRRRDIDLNTTDAYGSRAALTDLHVDIPCLVWPERSEIRTQDGERVEVSDYMATHDGRGCQDRRHPRQGRQPPREHARPSLTSGSWESTGTPDSYAYV